MSSPATSPIEPLVHRFRDRICPSLQRRGSHWVLIGGPVPAGAGAVTLGRLVIVRRRLAGSERLLRHEDVHVEQYRRLGVPRFVAQYLMAYLRWRCRGYPHEGAYRRIPLEVEAYWRERSGRRVPG